MSLSKLFSCFNPTSQTGKQKGDNKQSPKKIDQRKLMQNGYELTETPFVPDFLSRASEFKVFANGVLAFTLSENDSDTVDLESLEFIRKRLHFFFNKSPEIMRELKNYLSENILAVSIPQHNFQIGQSCQEFQPNPGFKTSPDSFLTYRKLSENIQVTYYNENGVEYLAGLCIYSVQNKTRFYSQNELLLINLARTAMEPYPLTDRAQNPVNLKWKRYGRFCKSAGKRVIVDHNEQYGKIRHYGYDHYALMETYEHCDECYDDFYSYKWENPKPAEPTSTSALSETETPSQSEVSIIGPSAATSTESLLDGFDKISIDDENEN